ncbi:helix-turn-helix domain-containing protein [Pedobacter jejuensis]|uniref:AraC family transcriptional regulator n=1 Tax=Pedobacter jejuensis TaxID=1268550 RepID=A0A3N0C1G6_9SPHI|nr:helix-turn-helix transcriptional regulator [Pedobacter jejuensis]RNL55876.1 AraC family transcriptional regulator [Pedobacter jejuensis]
MKHIKTISEFHQFRELPKPEHPLISVIDVASVKQLTSDEPTALLLDFYVIAMKKVSGAKMKYGQHQFDFDEGIMSFMAPNQVFSVTPVKIEEKIENSGWVLNIHPDFLWNTPLSGKINQYDFWDYSVNEALFLSEKEEATINSIISNIQQEYRSNIDKFSKQIIISQIESLLSYADRFYHRQFITREKHNHQILDRLETLVNDYFNNTDLINKGLPSVGFIAGALNLSPKYLSSLLKTLTGQNTQQYIHEKLIAKAKEKLSATDLSISEIAYQLGFEHLQSFSKLFKTKTKLSPLEFRQSFN